MAASLRPALLLRGRLQILGIGLNGYRLPPKGKRKKRTGGSQIGYEGRFARPKGRPKGEAQEGLSEVPLGAPYEMPLADFCGRILAAGAIPLMSA